MLNDTCRGHKANHPTHHKGPRAPQHSPCALTLAQQRDVWLGHQPRLVLLAVLPAILAVCVGALASVCPPPPAVTAGRHRLPPVVLQVFLILWPKPLQLSIVINAVAGLGAVGCRRVCCLLPADPSRLLILVIAARRPPAPAPQLALLLPQVPAAAWAGICRSRLLATLLSASRAARACGAAGP